MMQDTATVTMQCSQLYHTGSELFVLHFNYSWDPGLHTVICSCCSLSFAL